jgi:hypothetical protein
MDRTPLAGALGRTPNRILVRFGAVLGARLFANGVPDWLATVIERLGEATGGWGCGWDFGYERLEASRAERASGEARWRIAMLLIDLTEAVNDHTTASEQGPMWGDWMAGVDLMEEDRAYAESLVHYRDDAVGAITRAVELAEQNGLGIFELAEMFAQANWPRLAKRDADRFDAAVAALAVGHDKVARSLVYGRRQPSTTSRAYSRASAMSS